MSGYQVTDPDQSCTRCPAQAVCLHHVRTRGAGGPDEKWNLMPLCQKCHNSVHNLGLNEFTRRGPTVRAWLLTNNWKFDIHLGKWRHDAS